MIVDFNISTNWRLRLQPLAQILLAQGLSLQTNPSSISVCWSFTSCWRPIVWLNRRSRNVGVGWDVDHIISSIWQGILRGFDLRIGFSCKFFWPWQNDPRLIVSRHQKCFTLDKRCCPSFRSRYICLVTSSTHERCSLQFRPRHVRTFLDRLLSSCRFRSRGFRYNWRRGRGRVWLCCGIVIGVCSWLWFRAQRKFGALIRVGRTLSCSMYTILCANLGNCGVQQDPGLSLLRSPGNPDKNGAPRPKMSVWSPDKLT